MDLKRGLYGLAIFYERGKTHPKKRRIYRMAMTLEERKARKEEQRLKLIAERNALICKKLTRARKATGMSQKDLAILSGNTLQQIRKMENGEIVIPYRVAAGIAQILGTTVDKLPGGEK